MKERAKMYRYYVSVVYLNLEKDEIEFDYIETLAKSGVEASRNATDYMNRFPYVTHLKVEEISRM